MAGRSDLRHSGGPSACRLVDYSRDFISLARAHALSHPVLEVRGKQEELFDADAKNKQRGLTSLGPTVL